MFTKKKRHSTPRLFKAVAMKVERKKECLLVGEVSLLSVLGCHDVRVGLGVHSIFMFLRFLFITTNLHACHCYKYFQREVHTHKKRKDQSSKFQPWTFHSHSRKMGLMRSKKKLLWERERPIFFFFLVMEIKGIDPIGAAKVVFLPKHDHSNIILIRFSES